MRPAAWTTADIPDQTGRIALVTGANAGIGFEVASALCGAGAHVVLACRDRERASAAARAIAASAPAGTVDVVVVDLADLASVRAAASELAGRLDRIDLLVANAGVSMPPRQVTVDGFELQLATNHLGHFALVGLLLDRVLAGPTSRVVSLSSVTHPLGRIDFADLHHERHYGRVSSYAQSKLATLLFAFELDRRLRRAGSTAMALAAHPGSARTAIARHIPRIEALLAPVADLLQQSAADGALPVLRAGTDPSASGGTYYGPAGPAQWKGPPVLVRASRRAHDADTARRLWDVSARLTGVSYDFG